MFCWISAVPQLAWHSEWRFLTPLAEGKSPDSIDFRRCVKVRYKNHRNQIRDFSLPLFFPRKYHRTFNRICYSQPACESIYPWQITDVRFKASVRGTFDQFSFPYRTYFSLELCVSLLQLWREMPCVRDLS